MIAEAQNNIVDVCIIGAGPYGLSIAAHLRAKGVSFRIFGKPMSTWSTQMPKGMRLKSEGFASSLSEPSSTFTLAQYCRESGLPYFDIGLPVPLSTFIAYGLEFQKRFVPNLERVQVVKVRPSANGYELWLENGEIVSGRRVIMAVGITHFAYLPDVFVKVPRELISHSSDHSDLQKFKGKRVGIIGAGASALDLAALLRRAGASVELFARTDTIRFQDPPNGKPRTFADQLRAPRTGIGAGWRLFFCARTPQLFRLLPQKIRLTAVRKTLGPAPGWFVKDEVAGLVPFHLGAEVSAAQCIDGQVTLEVKGESGKTERHAFDHVIAATGYKVDLRRLTFIDEAIQNSLTDVEHTPVLSSNFESSVPGLYFVGTSAANTFGPLMRFAYGVEFVARRISKHLARTSVPGTKAQALTMEIEGKATGRQVLQKAQRG